MRLTVLIILTLLTTSANAYVGPGLGLGALGALLGAIVAVLLAIFGVVWYPMKRMFKKSKSPEPKDEGTVPGKEDSQGEDPVG